MKKKQYMKPDVMVCNVEPCQMMANSPTGGGDHRYDDPADGDIDVLVNKDKYTDIWGNPLY